MVELVEQQILIDGTPRLLIAGEIHYFRLDPNTWQDRLDKLKATGANTVASYIPWLCHETGEGEYNFTGQLDLAAFIDLCRDNGLWFLARPGPFVMAELKNEGLPYRLYEQHPEIIPVTWDGKPVETLTVDYLAPAFLDEALRWYAALAPILVPRLHPNGGNIIAVQLDNEVGMLSWITNSPDLTDLVLADFWNWLTDRFTPEDLEQRYPPDKVVATDRATGLRSPAEEYAPHLMRDLGHYMRHRFARYIAHLRSFAEELGITGVPFIVNLHGTADGSGAPFPIGISQLSESYTQAPGYLGGSDHYLGDLTFARAVDLYLINGFMAAVNRPEQPLASVEFECSEGDYDCSFAVRTDPSTADFKLRLCVAQGNRLVNLYLFAGGINGRLPHPVGDGNDRIGFTGERHGFNAPIDPEGQLSTTYPRLALSVRTLTAVASKLAVSREEHDDVTLGFIPDYYLTESIYPGSDSMKEIAANLTATRGGGPRTVLARAMLAASFRFPCLDIQNRPLDPATTPVLALASARYMDNSLQLKLVDYLAGGGKLLLIGQVPLFDMEAQPCTTLADYLGLRPAGERRASPKFHLSAVAEGWAAPRAEFRIGWAQLFEPTADPILRLYGSDLACGFDLNVGAGRAIVITADVPCEVDLFQTALKHLGAEPALNHGYPGHGIFLTTTITPNGERFIHLLNLDGFDKPVHLTEHGRDLLPARTLVLRRRDALLLPLSVSFNNIRIVASTAEITAIEPDAFTFRITQQQEVIEFETPRPIVPSETYAFVADGKRRVVRVRPTGRRETDAEEYITIRFA